MLGHCYANALITHMLSVVRNASCGILYVIRREE